MSSSPRHAGTLRGDGYILPCERGREDKCPTEEAMVTLGKVVNLAVDSCGITLTPKNLWKSRDKFEGL